MANALTVTKIFENQRNVVLVCSFAIDTAADSTFTVLDPTVGISPTKPATATFTIVEIWSNFSHFDAMLQYDASTPVNVWLMAATSGDSHIDFGTNSFNGFKDPGNAGTTGKILVKTIGAATTLCNGVFYLLVRKD